MTTIEQTVLAVGREIPRFSWRGRRDLLAEVRDGLEDAQEAYAAGGLSEQEAQQRAVAEFGDPGRIGRELAATLVGRSTQRAAALLGPGYVVMLLSWALFGHDGGHRLGAQAAAVASFGWFGVTAVAVAAFALLGGRRIGTRVTAGLVGAVGIAVTAGTWIASNVVAPWGWSPGAMMTQISSLEAVSFAATALIFLSSVHCLALTARRPSEPVRQPGWPGSRG